MSKDGTLIATHKNTTIFLRAEPDSENMFFDIYKNGEGVATVTVTRSQWESLESAHHYLPKKHIRRNRLINRIKRKN